MLIFYQRTLGFRPRDCGSNPHGAAKTKKMLTKEQIEIIAALAKKYPNDMDLGKNVRSLFRENSFVMTYPNDMDLGKELRKILSEKSK